MTKRLYAFRCPCCKNRLELDTANGKVRHLESLDGGLDSLVEQHKEETDRLANAFDQAAKDQQNQGQTLDDLFKKAADEASDLDEPPPHPFKQD